MWRRRGSVSPFVKSHFTNKNWIGCSRNINASKITPYTDGMLSPDFLFPRFLVFPRPILAIFLFYPDNFLYLMCVIWCVYNNRRVSTFSFHLTCIFHQLWCSDTSPLWDEGEWGTADRARGTPSNSGPHRRGVGDLHCLPLWPAATPLTLAAALQQGERDGFS